MRAAVLLSFIIYVGAFFAAQQVIGTVKGARNASPSGHPNSLLPAIQVLSMISWMAGIVTMEHSRLNGLVVLRLAGYVVITAGITVSMWAQFKLGSNWSGHVGVHKNHKLITTGPYRWVRNPLYAGMWISGLGLCLVTLNVFYGMAGLLWALAFSTRIRGEESVLRKKFKSKYDEYFNRTPMLVPGIGWIRKRC